MPIFSSLCVSVCVCHPYSVFLSVCVYLSPSVPFLVLASRQKHQRKPLTLKLAFGKNPVEQVCDHRVLGVVSDDDLKWQSHIDSIL